MKLDLERLGKNISDLPTEIRREILCETLSETTLPIIYVLFDNVNSIKRCRLFKNLDWNIISNTPLSEEFISDFQDRVNWVSVSKRSKLSESFIREFRDQVNWDYISDSQVLSESFIRHFSDRVNWVFVSSKQKLSEPFISEFRDYVNWTLISRYQTLSKNFIRSFQDYIDDYYIARNTGALEEISE